MEQVSVYIDGDNIHQQYWKRVMDIASEKGEVVACFIYTSVELPIQLAPCIETASFIGVYPGKNSADMLIAMDCMEQVFQNARATSYLIASSDSDFKNLVIRLKRYGKHVFGVGKFNISNEGYRSVFDEFYPLDPKLVLEQILNEIEMEMTLATLGQLLKEKGVTPVMLGADSLTVAIAMPGNLSDGFQHIPASNPPGGWVRRLKISQRQPEGISSKNPVEA